MLSEKDIPTNDTKMVACVESVDSTQCMCRKCRFDTVHTFDLSNKEGNNNC